MAEHLYDFRIIFVKMAEFDEQIAKEQGEICDDEIKEYNEIRALREIVMEVETKPQVLFATT
jgi:hypothetical protein